MYFHAVFNIVSQCKKCLAVHLEYFYKPGLSGTALSTLNYNSKTWQ